MTKLDNNARGIFVTLLTDVFVMKEFVMKSDGGTRHCTDPPWSAVLRKSEATEELTKSSREG